MSTQSEQQRVSVKVERKIWQEVGVYAKQLGMTKSQFVAYSLNKLLGDRLVSLEKDSLITDEEKDFLNQLLQAPPHTSVTKED